ncbi:MAG: hypothetical protein IIX90_06985 [Clostridia bacterium]|jgi:hypothetical protein|nr:hypothetical protein [Clostridia bacterium]
MKKSLALLLCICLFCATLSSCSNSLKSQVYATIETIDVNDYTAEAIMVTTYKTPRRQVERSLEDYEKLAAYGEEGARYILEYVIEVERIDYANAIFLTSCAYEILGVHEFPDIDIHYARELATALYEEIK